MLNKVFSNLFNTSEDQDLVHMSYNKIDDYINLPLSYYYPNSSILNYSLKNRFNFVKSTYKNNSEIKAYGEVNSLFEFYSMVKSKLKC